MRILPHVPTLGPLLVTVAVLGPPEGDASARYRPRAPSSESGTLEPIYALLSARLGVGPAFHPKLERDKGLAIDARFGAVFVIPPILAVWPELGASFEHRVGFERAMGTVDFNFGLPAFLYYGVGFMGGVEGHARLLGVRHGPDLRFFQVFGIAFVHCVTNTPVRAQQHEFQLMFSLDMLAMVPLSGKKGTMFQVGERRVGR
jgi:hypothetical protein